MNIWTVDGNQLLNPTDLPNVHCSPLGWPTWNPAKELIERDVLSVELIQGGEDGREVPATKSRKYPIVLHCYILRTFCPNLHRETEVGVGAVRLQELVTSFLEETHIPSVLLLVDEDVSDSPSREVRVSEDFLIHDDDRVSPKVACGHCENGTPRLAVEHGGPYCCLGDVFHTPQKSKYRS